VNHHAGWRAGQQKVHVGEPAADNLPRIIVGHRIGPDQREIMLIRTRDDAGHPGVVVAGKENDLIGRQCRLWLALGELARLDLNLDVIDHKILGGQRHGARDAQRLAGQHNLDIALIAGQHRAIGGIYGGLVRAVLDGGIRVGILHEERITDALLLLPVPFRPELDVLRPRCARGCPAEGRQAAHRRKQLHGGGFAGGADRDFH